MAPNFESNLSTKLLIAQKDKKFIFFQLWALASDNAKKKELNKKEFLRMKKSSLNNAL